MIPDNILLFIVLTTLVSMAPGPNVMFIMSQAALRGRRAGMMAGFGIQVANVFYFALTALGIGVLMSTSELAFFIVKWVGAGYLALLGVMAILRSFQRKLPPDHAQPSPVIRAGRGAFFDGLMIGLGNPKTIFWFLTFLPQFIDTKSDVLSQTVVLGRSVRSPIWACNGSTRTSAARCRGFSRRIMCGAGSSGALGLCSLRSR